MAYNSSRRNANLQYIETNFFDMWNLVDRASPDHAYTTDTLAARSSPFLLKSRKPMLETKQ